MKIKLCENSKQGHHKVYLDELLNIKNTEEYYIEKKLSSLKNSLFRFFLERKEILKKFTGQKSPIIHILYLDNLYIYPVFFKLNKRKKILGTLHFFPNNKLKVILLKNFLKKINLVVVHSEILKNRLLKIGIKNVEVVDYPSFYNYLKINSKIELINKNKLENKVILTALGGTRDDKGLDLFLEAFKYLSNDLKNKVILNVAGKEETFKRDFIREKAKEYKINLREEYGFLTDEKFMENVILTDIMVMPYRKIFGGNSGPMTEAIVNNIPCITPKGLNIGDLTEKYNLGLTFECENPEDLAKKIEDLILNKDKKEFFTTDFHERLTVENFLKSYEEIYTKLERGEY